MSVFDAGRDDVQDARRRCPSSSRRSDSLQRDDAGLGGGVGARGGEVGVAADRRVVDDHAAAALEHARAARALVRCATRDEVDLEHRVDRVHVLLLEQPAGHLAGVVDEQVDRRARSSAATHASIDSRLGEVDAHRAHLGARRRCGSNASGSRTPASTSRSGRAASASASARPMPRLAPVTSAVRAGEVHVVVRRTPRDRVVIARPRRTRSRCLLRIRRRRRPRPARRLRRGADRRARAARRAAGSGPPPATRPTQVPLRGLGAREIVRPRRRDRRRAARRRRCGRGSPPASPATSPTSSPPSPGAAGCPTAPRPRRSPSPAARRCSRAGASRAAVDALSARLRPRAAAGPVLVLLHPLGADRHVWEPVIGPPRRASAT